jgi:3'-phosphoadenosine 5'-phosphosulfate sulfotransferase (PAPS reductase)/FAD synthetase
MPWSMGKDSNVLVWLARKAFFGRVPFPVLHIDTTYEFPEMLEFREWATKHHNLNLIVKINAEARAGGIGYETHDPVTVTHELKTVALQQVLAEYKWDALITGIRRDEDPTRAKERYFSLRNAQFEWDYKDQPPEFWSQFVTTSSGKTFRSRKCILPEMENDSVRLAAVQSRSQSRALPPQSMKSFPSSKRQKQPSALAVRRTITSAMRCRS